MSRLTDAELVAIIESALRERTPWWRWITRRRLRHYRDQHRRRADDQLLRRRQLRNGL